MGIGELPSGQPGPLRLSETLMFGFSEFTHLFWVKILYLSRMSTWNFGQIVYHEFGIYITKFLKVIVSQK